MPLRSHHADVSIRFDRRPLLSPVLRALVPASGPVLDVDGDLEVLDLATVRARLDRSIDDYERAIEALSA